MSNDPTRDADDILPTMDEKSVEVIVSCQGEFYSEPPADHRARYQWAIDRLRAASVDMPGGWGPVVDIGCGSGYGVNMIEEAGFTSFGLERNPMALEFCRSRKARAYLIDYPCQPFKVRSNWWAAVIMEVIEHNANGLVVFEQATKDASIVLASVPYNEEPGVNPYHRLSRLTDEVFRALALPIGSTLYTERMGSSLMLCWTDSAA